MNSQFSYFLIKPLNSHVYNVHKTTNVYNCLINRYFKCKTRVNGTTGTVNIYPSSFSWFKNFVFLLPKSGFKKSS